MTIRRITKLFLFSIASIAFLLVSAVIAFHFLFQTGYARRLIQDRINSTIPGHVSWDAQRLSLFKGQLALEGARVGGIENETIIEADHLSVDIGLKKLLGKKLVIERAQLNQPGVFLETGADGRLNLIRAFVGAGKPEPEAEPETEGSGFDIQIDELTLEKGRFSFVLPASAKRAEARHLHLEDISITIADANWGTRSGRLNITIGGGDVDIAGMDTPLRTLALSTVLADGRLDPLKLELKTPDSRLHLAGAAAGIFNLDQLEIDAELTLDAQLDDIRRIFRLGVDLTGPATLQLTAVGALDNPEMTLKLDYGGGRLAGTAIGRIALEGRMQNRQVAINRLDTDTPYGKFASTGSIDLQTAFADGFLSAPTNLSALAYRLDVKGKESSLSTFPGMTGVSGNLTSRILVEGKGVSPENLTARAEVDIQGEGLGVKSVLQPVDLSIAAAAEMSGGILTVDRLSADGRDAQLKISGKYGLSDKRLDLTATAGIPDLEKLLAAFGVSGISGDTVMVSADISGTAAEPMINARLQGDRITYQRYAIGDIASDLRFADGRLAILGLDLENGASKVGLTGEIQVLDSQSRAFLADPDIDLSLNAEPLHLRDFMPDLPDISGQFSIGADIAGSLKHPAGTINIDGNDLDLGVQSLSTVRLASRLEDGKLLVDSLEATLAPEQHLRAKGWASLDGSYELQMESDPIDLKSIDRMADTDMAGRIALTAEGKGRFASPELIGDVLLSEFSAGNKDLPDLRIGVALKNGLIQVSTSDPFTVNARYDISARDFAATAELSATELAPLFQLAGRRDLTGEVTGKISADGNIGDLKGMTALLHLSDLVVLQKETELVATTDFTAELEAGRIHIPISRVRLLTEGFVEIQGTGSLDGQLDVTASGAFPTALVGTMVQGIGQPEGSLALNLQVGGSLNQPRISGEAILQSVGLTLVDTMQRLHQVNGSIRLEEQAVTVSGLNGRLDGGDFSLDGTLGLNNYRPARADLNLTAHALPININGMLEMQINADLNLAGTPENSSLTGDLVLLEGIYFKNVNLSLVDQAGKIGQRRRQTAPRPKTGGTDIPFVKNLSMDVSLRSRNPFVVDNNLALLNIRPALRIHGTAGNPLITGRAQVNEGTITYRDTEFDVKKGVVDFVNPYRIEPTVDIRAEAEVRQWVITLSVGGTPDNLDFKLSSNPPEDDADILSLLVVGKTTQELASGSGGTARSPEEMLANLVAGKLAKQVKAGTGLDIVEVEYRKNGAAEAEAADEVKVTVGKELSRRLTVKYGVERKSGIVVQQSTAIYKLLEYLSVNAFQDTEGDFGGEMRYRLEFR